MCMCVYIHIYTRTYIHTNIHMFTDISMHYTHTYIFTHECIHMFTYKDICLQIYPCIWFYLFERLGNRHRKIFHLLNYSPNACNSWAQTRSKPGASNSVWISCMGDRDLSTWTITCWLPRCKVTGSQNPNRTGTETLAPLCRMLVS